MTGRFFRGPISWDDYNNRLDVIPPEGIEPPEPRYNIPPMSWVPVIRPRLFHQPGHEVALMLWSLVPMWWTKPLSEKKWTSFTAQCEGIDDSPTFRGAFRYRRCLVPASGFFQWSGEKGKRIPFAIGLNDQPWICFAGIWETWGHDGGEIDTFAILTTSANSLTGAHGTRMPVILKPEDYAAWLAPPSPKMARLFTPFPAEEMEEWPVNEAVGNIRNQGPELIAR
jgi:putative SOS response-associated peptidase YedK